MPDSTDVLFSKRYNCLPFVSLFEFFLLFFQTLESKLLWHCKSALISVASLALRDKDVFPNHNVHKQMLDAVLATQGQDGRHNVCNGS